jgi:hypothetical protein
MKADPAAQTAKTYVWWHPKLADIGYWEVDFGTPDAGQAPLCKDGQTKFNGGNGGLDTCQFDTANAKGTYIYSLKVTKGTCNASSGTVTVGDPPVATGKSAKK